MDWTNSEPLAGSPLLNSGYSSLTLTSANAKAAVKAAGNAIMFFFICWTFFAVPTFFVSNST